MNSSMTDQPTPNIRLTNGRLVTTSLDVAGHFGKRHKNVLRDIERIQKHASEEFNRLNFEPVNYLDPKNELRPMYRITRDGFALLAMGFTGREAVEWKIRFLETFNRLEQALRVGRETYHGQMEKTLFADHPRWRAVRDGLDFGFPMETILIRTGYKSRSSIWRAARRMERYGILVRLEGQRKRYRWWAPFKTIEGKNSREGQ
ncbi:MAG: putative antirepressor [Magnetococcales bacterium]|nr:putative antirepressor [Magnetococcales bacterium]HIJ83540.1 Rha family transcriptional regulator [Magnetococcales bacterium]